MSASAGKRTPANHRCDRNAEEAAAAERPQRGGTLPGGAAALRRLQAGEVPPRLVFDQPHQQERHEEQHEEQEQPASPGRWGKNGTPPDHAAAVAIGTT